MTKEIHFWIGDGYPVDTCVTYKDMLCKLRNNTPVLHTTQIHFLDTELFVRGYRIYVHINAHTCKEIRLGDKTLTNKLIHENHNLERLLLMGDFGDIRYDEQEKLA